MRRNPMAYGVPLSDREGDPQLLERRRQLIMQAAETLDDHKVTSDSISILATACSDVVVRLPSRYLPVSRRRLLVSLVYTGPVYWVIVATGLGLSETNYLRPVKNFLCMRTPLRVLRLCIFLYEPFFLFLQSCTHDEGARFRQTTR